MRRTTVGAIAVAAAAALIPLSGPTGSAHPTSPPDEIALPDGWQPEGITTDGRHLYAGSLADGAIWRASAKTGEGELLAPGEAGRVAAGVDYDRKRDILWVAGGPTREVRAQDADTGEVLATYSFPSDDDRFLNDLTVTARAVLATDSFQQELMVIPFRHVAAAHSKHGAKLPPASAAFTQALTGDVEYGPDFNLNGIVKVHHRVLAVQTSTGQLFRINQRTGNTREVDTHGANLLNGDGLESKGRWLFVVRNVDNVVPVLRVNGNGLKAWQIDELSDDRLDVPATAAYARGSLWAVNARFFTTPEPDTPYWITRLAVGHHH